MHAARLGARLSCPNSDGHAVCYADADTDTDTDTDAGSNSNSNSVSLARDLCCNCSLSRRAAVGASGDRNLATRKES